MMLNKLLVSKSDVPWLVRLDWGYNSKNFHQLKEWVKGIPGSKYNGKPSYTWNFPIEMLGALKERAEGLGYTVSGSPFKSISCQDSPPSHLHDHQQQAFREALANQHPIRFLLTDEAGLGKTAEAIAVARSLTNNRVLIVCPASLVGKWKRELKKWWDTDRPMIITPKDGYPYRGHRSIRIISYHRLESEITNKYDVILFDEVHHLQSHTSKFTQMAKKLLETNPDAHAIGATATVFPDRPRNLHSVVDTLCPGRFGSLSKFSFRYTNPVPVDVDGETRYQYEGVRNPEELRRRLGAFSCRTTKQSVMHLLTMPNIRAVRVPRRSKFVHQGGDVKEWLGRALNWACRQKLPHIKEWHEGSKATHKCIMVHHKDLVKEVGKVLGKHNVFKLTGSVNAARRDDILEKTRDLPFATVVATMHCIGEGLDLEHFQAAMFAELYWRPKTVIQALNRFPRLGGSAVDIDFLIMEGTADEIVAETLLSKLTDIGQLQTHGVGELKLLEALGEVDEAAIEDHILETLMAGFGEDLLEAE